MEEVNRELFARKVRELRKSNGLSQGVFAKNVNLSRSCIANYEAGRRYPGMEIVAYMASCFGIGAEYFSQE